jgi:C1A family cysteine protease
MRKSTLCLLVVAICAVWPQPARATPDNDWFLEQLQEELHRRGDPWIAGHTSVSELPIETKRRMVGLLPQVFETMKIVRRKSLTTLPSEWDWRTHDGHCWMTRIRAQGSCGSCWDFGCTATLEARWNIWNNTPENDLDLSEQFILSCNPFGYDCSGGRLDIWNWVMNGTNGVPDEDCFPYVASAVACEPCSNWVSRAAPYDIVDWGGTPRDPESMKYEIMRGPIAIGIAVKEDFFYYKSGVYEPIMGDNLSAEEEKDYNHGVCCVGWTSGDAWIFKNSWGPSWGSSDLGCWDEKGYGQIAEAGWPTWMDPIPPPVPFLTVKEICIRNDDNGNERLDPGESADILVLLKNSGGADVSAVNATLRIEGTDITVIDSTANYGDIPKDSSVINVSDPFHVEVSPAASEGPQEAVISISGDSGYVTTLHCQVWIGEKRMHWADIVTDVAVLTTTDNSSIGFDTLEGAGSGFIYPSDTLYTNTLHSGAMAFGNSSSYVVDNWYVSGNVERDWVPTTSPDGRLTWVSPPTRGNTMLHGQYSDAGMSAPQNIVCEHDAWGFKTNPDCDDFAVLSYRYTNHGGSAVTGLYAALFCDFNIGAVAKTWNFADINESKYLAWVDDRSIYAGVTLLDPLDLFANASTILNSDFVQDGMTDTNQYKFMNRTHHFGFQHTYDFSVMVSSGPFDLNPGESRIVAFAVVGGMSKQDIEAHADAARNCYQQITVEEKPGTMFQDVNLITTPNPASKKVVISFSLAQPCEGNVRIYDLSGRLVHSFGQNEFKPGVHQLEWDTSGTRRGLFFVKFRAGEIVLTKKALVL